MRDEVMCFDVVIWIGMIHTCLFFTSHMWQYLLVVETHTLVDRRVVITASLLMNRQVTYDGTVDSSGCLISLWDRYVEKGPGNKRAPEC